MQAVHVGPEELRDLIDDPGASLPGVDGPPVLVVDVGPASRMALGERSLAGLRAVVVGRSDDPADRPTWCDLVLTHADDDAAELAAVVSTVARNPTASSTLVELLRVCEAMTTDAGLLAESASYGVLQAGSEFAAWREQRRAAARGDRSPQDAQHVQRPLLARRTGDVLHLTLHRPERRNALDVSMRDTLVEQLHLVQLDPTIAAVVLDGHGPDFCSGGDLDEFGTAHDASLAHLIRLERSIGRSLSAVADRLLVRLHGACIGSGIELAAFASTVHAADDVTIGLPEYRDGLDPGRGRHRVAHTPDRSAPDLSTRVVGLPDRRNDRARVGPDRRAASVAASLAAFLDTRPGRTVTLGVTFVSPLRGWTVTERDAMGVGRRGDGPRVPAATSRGDKAATELSERFDAVVGQLVGDESWHRQLRSVRRRHRASRVGSWVLHGFAEVGCWFTGVPAQRCTARPPARPTGEP